MARFKLMTLDGCSQCTHIHRHGVNVRGEVEYRCKLLDRKVFLDSSFADDCPLPDAPDIMEGANLHLTTGQVTPCDRIGGCLKVIVGPEAECKCDN